MKRTILALPRYALSIGLLLGAVSIALPVTAAATPDSSGVTLPAVTLRPESKLWLEGKSTLHDYMSEATKLEVSLSGAADRAMPADLSALGALVCSGGVSAGELVIPVAGLKSEKDGLDKNLRKSLLAEAHPLIRYRLRGYHVAPGESDSFKVRASGVLEVAGKQKEIESDLIARPTALGVWLTGTQPLRMTDFGIKPPKMMLGTIRTDDEVVIHYRLLLALKPTTSGGSVERSQP